MEYYFVKGFFVVFLIQHCTSEGLNTQFSTAVTLKDGQALPQESELPPAEVPPVVAPPSLKELQQAVQEASEQVEGRGAEEVLKELLERVVEAALGQVEGGGEAKADETAVQEVAGEDALGAETDTEIDMLEQEEVEGEVTGAEGGYAGMGEEQDEAEVDAFEDVAGEGKEVEGEAVAGSVEETTAGVKTGGREAGRVEVMDDSLDTGVSQEIVEETGAALEETGGYLAVGEDSEEQVILSEEKAAAETETQEETPRFVEVAAGRETEQKVVLDSDSSMVVDDVEQIGDAQRNEETQVNTVEGEVTGLHSDDYGIEITQTVEEEKEEVNIVKDAKGLEVEDGQGHLVVEEGAAEEAEAEDAEVGEGETYGGSVVTEESVALVNEEGDQQAGEEQQIALSTSHVSEKEDQEVLVISDPEPEYDGEAPTEESPENQAPTPNPSLETGENTIGDEKSNNGNEIIILSDDLLPLDHGAAQPTLDNFVKDFLAEPPQAEGEEPGEVNELVEDTTGKTETSELSLEAWKIGAISAAAFLVLETLIIIIYIFKCRNKNSALALQRACEEGCVDPEATTGGDCSDDTLPAGNGDAQQIAALDPADVASTLAQNKEQHEGEHVIAMSDLPRRSAEESASTAPGPDSSQDLRTSIL